MRNNRVFLNLKRQAGWTATQLLTWGIGVGFVVYCAFKIAPAYNENLLVKAGLKEYAERYPKEMMVAKKSHVKRHLESYYTLNGVRTIDPNNFSIEKHKGRVLINIDYEVRVPLIANVDVVMKFANQLDSTNPEGCCKVLIDPKQKKLPGRIELPDKVQQHGL